MGSFFEINDTLQISTEQGFPSELEYQAHIKKPFTAEMFSERLFTFKDKPNVRLYQIPPVRVFLVHNMNGKWLYWGLINITKLVLDYNKRTTSGEYKIIRIFTPSEMKNAEFTMHNDQASRYLDNLK